MALARWTLSVALAALLPGCVGDEPQPTAPAPSVPQAVAPPPTAPQPTAPQPIAPPPTAKVPNAVEPTPTPAPVEPEAPDPPVFDPLTAAEADVRIAVVHSVKGPACGVLHTVGAIEVDVLGVGTPAPRLGLYISCPADLQPRGMLTIGTTLHVTLHRGKQRWPKPAVRPPAELPVRYVRSLERTAAPK